MNQAAFTFTPRPPQRCKPGWLGAKTARPEGGGIAFFYHGHRRVSEKHGDCTPEHPANPHGSKEKCPPGFFQNPRFGVVFPRFGLFSTRFVFFGFAPLFLSFFQITEERKERRGISGWGPSIPGFDFGKPTFLKIRVVVFPKPGDCEEVTSAKYSNKSTIFDFIPGFFGVFQKCVWVSAGGLTSRRGYGLCALD